MTGNHPGKVRNADELQRSLILGVQLAAPDSTGSTLPSMPVKPAAPARRKWVYLGELRPRHSSVLDRAPHRQPQDREHFGREPGTPCVTNIRFPGYFRAITPIDRATPRRLLHESLSAAPGDRHYNLDAVESKLFGLGLKVMLSLARVLPLATR